MTDVSIIIPTFNRAAFLGHAIDSALVQGDGLEVIVVDDGSTDATAALLGGYGDRIRLLRQVNSGPSAARNLAAEAARGHYFFFADSDDLIEPGAVKALLEEARKVGPSRIVFGRAVTIDRDGQPCDGTTYGFAAAEPGEELDLPTLLSGTMPLCLSLIPAPIFRSLGGLRPELRLGEDGEFALRVHSAGYRYVATGIPTIKVLLHDAPRLSGIANPEFGSRAVQLWSAITEQAVALLDFDGRARETLARMIWVAGRDAARARSAEAANQLFAMAMSLDGSIRRLDPMPLHLLGRGVGPYRAERAAEWVKALIRRR